GRWNLKIGASPSNESDLPLVLCPCRLSGCRLLSEVTEVTDRRGYESDLQMKALTEQDLEEKGLNHDWLSG
ncbi:Hypothetical predicted protein, partial [Olea europaea subsp. europaea]